MHWGKGKKNTNIKCKWKRESVREDESNKFSNPEMAPSASHNSSWQIRPLRMRIDRGRTMIFLPGSLGVLLRMRYEYHTNLQFLCRIQAAMTKRAPRPPAYSDCRCSRVLRPWRHAASVMATYLSDFPIDFTGFGPTCCIEPLIKTPSASAVGGSPLAISCSAKLEPCPLPLKSCLS